MSIDSLRLSSWCGAVIAIAGFASLTATYWDDAWHTDLGRDSAMIPPHLWLYGSVAVAGAVVLFWAGRVLVSTRSIRSALRFAPLVVAALGGAATLAAAPLDAAWHSTFGRDAVLWSAPHMLVVFASAAMVLGIIAGVRPSRYGVVEAMLAALLLGGLMTAVLEYETDVPQFSEAYYLPVLLAAALVAGAVARAALPVAASLTMTVGIYFVVRLVITVVLLLLGRSTPEIPLAVLGLCVLDLRWRNSVLRYTGAAAAISALAWISAATGVADRPAATVAPLAVVAVAVFAVVLLANMRQGRVVAVTVVALFAGGFAMSGTPAASAHDPGEGESAGTAAVIGTSDGNGHLSLTVAPIGSCDGTSASSIVARRAGRVVTAPLRASGPCSYDGSVQVDGAGRWFVYAELHRRAGDVEVWLPLPADRSSMVSEVRDLYRPAGSTASTRTIEIVSGTAIYALAAALMTAGVIVVVRTGRPSATAGARA
ncbi:MULTISPECIES: hypothetical protein [Nocardia]|uniref:hypothetical protein n=1 Tax=Nocardia TaxID=1817 RepID=UPI000AC6B1EB|nr:MULTISPECIES: hypothetical protein [Nocardia]MCC3316750.1 hypothetical protein [Nocardia africana]